MTYNASTDTALASAISLVESSLRGDTPRPEVTSFFDEATFTVSHVVHAPDDDACAIIDSVLDFDMPSGRIGHASAERLARHVDEQRLQVTWVLETHVHADHLSAAPWLQQRLGGQTAIGQKVTRVQESFGRIFNADKRFARDGSQFDRLFGDGDRFRIGALAAVALHVPGHTPACMAYVIGDAVFVGDTLFMPDYGSARCDFPGGDAAMLYRSIRRLFALPDATRVFLCHDYKAPGRENYTWETTMGAERYGNIHVREGIAEADFVAMRQARDATLPAPRLLFPSVQVNMRGGCLPEPEDNGRRYLKLPLDAL